MKELTVTISKFAKDNGLNVMRLRGTLLRDDSIKPQFVLVSAYYYSLDGLTDWFSKNKHRFTDECKSVVVAADTEFYCGTNDHYVSISEKGASGKRCASCDAKVIKANTGRVVTYKGNGNKVPEHIKAFELKKANIAHDKLLSSIDDYHSTKWMEQI